MAAGDAAITAGAPPVATAALSAQSRVGLLLCLGACAPSTSSLADGSVDRNEQGSRLAPALRATPAPMPSAVPACAEVRCDQALPLQPLDPWSSATQRQSVVGDTTCAPSAATTAVCASAGPELHYQLDLSAFAQPVPVAVTLAAEFDATVRIDRGPCEDPLTRVCRGGLADLVGASFVRQVLEPAQYRIVVDGAHADAAGAFQLSVELPSNPVSCSEPPANNVCDQATVIDLSSGGRSVVGTTRCATDDGAAPFECGGFDDRAGDVFYALDLSERDEPVLIHATTAVDPTAGDTALYLLNGRCGEPVACSDDGAASGRAGASSVWAYLAPGRYTLGVEGREGPVDFGLAVSVETGCEDTPDTCSSARDIEPRLGSQTLSLMPGCGSDTIATACNSLGQRDLFYRLDLSRSSQPLRVGVSLTNGSGAYLASVVLFSGIDGNCGNELWCGDFELVLDPAEYFLAVDVDLSWTGPATLHVDIEELEVSERALCIDQEIAGCAGSEGCCRGEGSECWLAFMACGLGRPALDCVCDSEPGCCGQGRPDRPCEDVYSECGSYCPGFGLGAVCPP